MTATTRHRADRCAGPAGGRRRGWIPVTLGVTLVSAVAGLDYLSGPVVSVDLLYVLVVMAITWVGCRRHAVLVAVLAAAEGLGAQVAAARGAVPALPTVWNALTDLVVLTLVAVLLDTLHSAVEHHRHLATVDSLTGAMNRRAFEIAAERERLRAARHGTPLSLAYLDVDHFKAANDRLGHHAGDRVLEQVAAAIAHSVRATDLFARMGGDEFVLLLPETDAREAMTVVQRVRAAAASAGREAGHPTRCRRASPPSASLPSRWTPCWPPPTTCSTGPRTPAATGWSAPSLPVPGRGGPPLRCSPICACWPPAPRGGTERSERETSRPRPS